MYGGSDPQEGDQTGRLLLPLGPLERLPPAPQPSQSAGKDGDLLALCSQVPSVLGNARPQPGLPTPRQGRHMLWVPSQPRGV